MGKHISQGRCKVPSQIGPESSDLKFTRVYFFSFFTSRRAACSMWSSQLLLSHFFFIPWALSFASPKLHCCCLPGSREEERECRESMPVDWSPRHRSGTCQCYSLSFDNDVVLWPQLTAVGLNSQDLAAILLLGWLLWTPSHVYHNRKIIRYMF